MGGWRPGKGERSDTVGSLLLGIPDGKKLRYVGRVGSGFSMRELKELRQTMDGLARKSSPFDDVPAARRSRRPLGQPGARGRGDVRRVDRQRKTQASRVARLAAGQEAGGRRRRIRPELPDARAKLPATRKRPGDTRIRRVARPNSGILRPFAVLSGLGRVRHLGAAGPVDRGHGGLLAHAAVARTAVLGVAALTVAVRPLPRLRPWPR